MTTSGIVSLIVTALNLVPIMIYFTTRQRQEPVMRFFAIMLVAHFAYDVVGIPTFILGDQSTSLALANLYSVVETVMIVLLFRAKLDERLRTPLWILGAGILSVQLYQIIVDPGIFVFPIFSRMVVSLSVTMLAILYFYKLLKDLPEVHIFRVPMLWINIGLLVFFTGNFMLFVLKDYMTDMLANDLRFYWGYHNFLTALSYVLYSVGLLQATPARGVLNTDRR
jgi:hypothetical protein